MEQRTGLSRITIDIPAKDHKKLKALSALLGKSMREIVIESIEEHLNKAHYPNKETKKVIEEIEKGKGLIKSKNAADLFKKLGI